MSDFTHCGLKIWKDQTIVDACDAPVVGGFGLFPMITGHHTAPIRMDYVVMFCAQHRDQLVDVIEGPDGLGNYVIQFEGTVDEVLDWRAARMSKAT